MDKAGIADTMEKIATLLELKGENPFKIRAYTNAARSIETWGGNVSDLRDQETLEKIPGIGKAIAAKIKELVETGSLKFFEELRAEFPEGILELFTLPGLGGKKIKALYEQLHSARSRSCGRRVKAIAWRSCPVSARPPRKRSAAPSRIA